MWWILLPVLFLIFLEHRITSGQRLNYFPNLKNYFWLFTNLIILSFFMSYLIPLLTDLLEFLRIPTVINVSTYPLVLQFFFFILLADLSKFSLHWITHRSDFLWKFHMVHHSSVEINTLAAFKHSWAEAILTAFVSCVLAKIFLINLQLLILINGLFLCACIWQHSNLNYFKNPFLGGIFITPKTHRIHHERVDGAQHSNFGFLLTCWDRIFGTYSSIPKSKLIYGISDETYPHHSNLRQFFYPFLSSSQKTSKRAGP